MGIAALSFSPSCDGAVPPRFVVALAASAFAHLFLVQALVFDVPQRAARLARAGMMTVRIAVPVPPVTAPQELPSVAPRIGTEVSAAGGGRLDPTDARSQRDPVTPLALAQAPDPTFYSVRDLDVYPRPAVPLDFDRLGARGTESPGGRFRVVLLIDEGGVVNEIAITEAEPPGRLRDELRAVLAATRFIPGQKDGRAVKSRVVLSVTLDPARSGTAPSP